MKGGRGTAAGFALVECLVSISVLGLMLPTVLMVISTSSVHREKSKGLFRCAEIAQEVFADLPSLWSEAPGLIFGEGQIFGFPEIGEGASFLFDSEGGVAPLPSPDIALTGGIAARSGFVVSVRQEEDSTLLGSEEFVVEVSYPAGRPAARREKKEYKLRFRAR